MCGISLLINTRDKQVSSRLTLAMNNKVAHRGPDGDGFHFGNNFAMGHRRLSIIDLSDAGKQPMNRNDDWIIFNGMIYNFVELRKELEDWGHEFHSNTDTEVLLAACQQWGIEAFKKLNGMWAFAWYRASKKEIVLCRDHFGIKPLYYTQSGEFFAAASEIKQFSVLPDFQPVLNKSATINFLVNGSLNYSDQTFFEGVQELKGGHYLVYNLATHKFKVNQWYNLAQETTEKKVPFAEAVKEVRKLFADSVNIRMRSDVPVGSCLSGGIDSTAIVSYVHSSGIAAEDFATITSCYDNKLYDEREYSDLVSNETGFKALKVFPDLNQLLDNNELDKILYHQDQPFSTASHYSEHQVFKTARKNHLTVMLDGQGSDEFICGYYEFFMAYLRELLHSGKIKKFLENVRAKARHEGSSTYGFIKGYYKITYWYPAIRRIKSLLRRSSRTWLNKSWDKLADRELKNFDKATTRSLSLQQMIYSSLPLQLHSEDRNSMMFSVESRLPFLDYRLVEYVLSLPSDFKIKNGYSKFILRQAVKEIPAKIRARTTKMGFAAPDEPWLRDNHFQIREELQDAVMNTGIFSKQLLQDFDSFIEGKTYYEPIYFRAIALNHFIKVFDMQQHRNPITHRVSAEKMFEPFIQQ